MSDKLPSVDDAIKMLCNATVCKCCRDKGTNELERIQLIGDRFYHIVNHIVSIYERYDVKDEDRLLKKTDIIPIHTEKKSE